MSGKITNVDDYKSKKWVKQNKKKFLSSGVNMISPEEIKPLKMLTIDEFTLILNKVQGSKRNVYEVRPHFVDRTYAPFIEFHTLTEEGVKTFSNIKGEKESMYEEIVAWLEDKSS
ncbi:hypothetical protein [Bacillus taeanensis]|uniref:Uncharacterized protein n=1 Tax=Bacillus taeanensis TaxID=273032 RepID=A0A366XTT4_9BACI|nr:hypothetical protein [Bacillus taeanensis]RBW69076.1 hypothetical protein DS031_13025 [Bacillus taeanensis]